MIEVHSKGLRLGLGLEIDALRQMPISKNTAKVVGSADEALARPCPNIKVPARKAVTTLMATGPFSGSFQQLVAALDKLFARTTTNLVGSLLDSIILQSIVLCKQATSVQLSLAFPYSAGRYCSTYTSTSC